MANLCTNFFHYLGLNLAEVGDALIDASVEATADRLGAADVGGAGRTEEKLKLLDGICLIASISYSVAMDAPAVAAISAENVTSSMTKLFG